MRSMDRSFVANAVRGRNLALCTQSWPPSKAKAAVGLGFWAVILFPCVHKTKLLHDFSFFRAFNLQEGKGTFRAEYTPAKGGGG